MKQDDAKDFIAAMLKEVEVHENRSHWACMLKSDVPKVKLDKNGKLEAILSIWSFKRERFLSGKLMKHKPRFCAPAMSRPHHLALTSRPHLLTLTQFNAK
eukprot:13458452-Ditylum_brightwellii.AAC.1